MHQLIHLGRIDESTGIDLFESTAFYPLMELANMVKQSRFAKHVFFNNNLHVNTTNICVLACRFCAFRKGPRHSDAYELSVEEYIHRIEPLSSEVDEVHSVGGLHPSWTIEHYEALYSTTKEKFPHIHIKSLTAVEIKHLANRSNLSVDQTLSRLKASGLDSIPGGGAEILVDSIRDRICRGKESSQEYLDIHRKAHELNIPTNCTMLFGTIESTQDRIIHFLRLRELQDETGGFQCFVPYPFLSDKTRLPEAKLATGNEILRVIAVSRLMLDNIPHIKAYRMNIGDHIGQIALSSGADDIDGTVGHEEIMHIAGSTTPVSSSTLDICRLIEQTGGVPVKRDSIYTQFEVLSSTPKSHVLPVHS
ncbi:MAG TPA: CofH family radical SAM protein [Candidatus Thalassarchaeaceae archaeon]|nr:CofH family radical SAM protein [Candidatus Thalassarchaeaceae archaeon]HJM30285.1 CofH family radical SAM protein [Candidatus Thalassarchaeaceae archaeon]